MKSEFQTHLQAEFEERSRKNPRFSLRAFARMLELAPSTVHQYLSGRYYPSVRNLQQIASRLTWPDDRLDAYLRQAIPSSTPKARKKVSGRLRIAADRLAEVEHEFGVFAANLESRFGTAAIDGGEYLLELKPAR